MNLEEALFEHLRTGELLAGVVGERIYPYTYPVPQGDEPFEDCLVYLLKSEQPRGALADLSPVVGVYVIACVSADPSRPAELADLLKRTLTGFQGELGGVGGVRVQSIKRVDAGDEFDEQAGLFIRWCEFSIDYCT